jgi:hypothetical protein
LFLGVFHTLIERACLRIEVFGRACFCEWEKAYIVVIEFSCLISMLESMDLEDVGYAAYTKNLKIQVVR